MSESQKPLCYDAIGSIIESMSINKRVEIYLKCPTIRKLERRVPLYIEHLEFDDYRIKLDDFEYKVLHLNVEQGIQDINTFGTECVEMDSVLTPGDIDFAYYITKIWMQSCLVLRPDGTYRYGDEIEGDQGPRDHWTQVTITTPAGKTFQRTPYDRPLFHAMKHLGTLFFANRESPIKVGFLDIKTGVTIRLPVDVKFKVNHILVNFIMSYYAYLTEQILDPESIPFKRVTYSNLEDLDHSYVRNAKEHVYDDNCQIRPNLEPLGEHRNLIIIVRENPTTLHHYLSIVHSWVENGKEIGCRLQMECPLEITRDAMFNTLQNEYPQEEVNTNELVIKMKAGGNVLVVYSRNRNGKYNIVIESRMETVKAAVSEDVTAKKRKC
ncbi:hypothetical protein L5515_018236 [Caenorhabditis briggsae]|uniref:Uncharacterized protein n=1 Tax=Caenorhabditis briggsae TaxID=6238 RepID=A0AAE9JSN5_CAEBR|nr:hypothetical protein L5515_018236 [Caenorhabditis briggsae]